MSKEPTTNSQGLSEECHAMISRISHEVRNPVAVIHSFHQLLLLFFSNTFLHFSLPTNPEPRKVRRMFSPAQDGYLNHSCKWSRP